jgi:hypothetical protein
MRRSAYLRPALASAWIGLFSLGSFITPSGRTAHAQTEAELTSARKLFAEAVRDEDQKRFDAALEKFKRVQQVKDTQPVRYRIATCLEALGRVRQAYAMYDASARATAGATPEVTRAAREHMETLGRRAASLRLTLSPHAPADADVRIDGEPIAASALAAPIMVDPGTHQITATATNVPPFQGQVTVSEGAQAGLLVMLEPAGAPPPPPPIEPPPQPARTSGGSGRTTAGIAAIAGGGVLIAAAGITLLLRHGEIDELNRSCPGGHCPGDRESELGAARDRAKVEGPLAITFGAVGLAAAGIGVYLLATAPSKDGGRAIVTLAPVAGGGGVLVRGSF